MTLHQSDLEVKIRTFSKTSTPTLAKTGQNSQLRLIPAPTPHFCSHATLNFQLLRNNLYGWQDHKTLRRLDYLTWFSWPKVFWYQACYTGCKIRILEQFCLMFFCQFSRRFAPIRAQTEKEICDYTTPPPPRGYAICITYAICIIDYISGIHQQLYRDRTRGFAVSNWIGHQMCIKVGMRSIAITLRKYLPKLLSFGGIPRQIEQKSAVLHLTISDFIINLWASSCVAPDITLMFFAHSDHRSSKYRASNFYKMLHLYIFERP